MDLRQRLHATLAEITTACDLFRDDAGRRSVPAALADLTRILETAGRLVGMVTHGLDESTPAAPPDAGITPAATLAPPAPSTVSMPGTVLVVDDDSENRELLARLLERLGHTVAIAAGGQQALDLLHARPFDLLLLDVMMPGMDGFGVLARLKADPRLRKLPVIVLSAMGDVTAAVRCIELGADDNLPKPFDTVLLRARIGGCLKKKRLRDRELAYLRQAARVTGPAVIAHLLVTSNVDLPLEVAARALLTAIDRVAERLQLAKGETLFTVRAPGDSMYAVLSGRVQLREADGQGFEQVIGVARSGEPVGELDR